MKWLTLVLCLSAGQAQACDEIGIRNNNPGNLRTGFGCRWYGQVGQDDWQHIKFKYRAQGLRAIKVLLATYKNAYGVNTVEGLTKRWISKKATPAAFRSWAGVMRQRLHSKPGQVIDLTNPVVIEALLRGITWAENGCDPYPDWLYREVAYGPVGRSR